MPCDLDEAVFRALNAAGANVGLDAVMVAAAVAGTALLLALLAVPLWWSGRREHALDLLVVLVLTLIATDLLKLAIDRARPCEALDDVNLVACIACPSDPSMPSGHSSRAFGVAVVLAASLSRRYGAAAIAGAGFIGLSRVYLGVHWPSDIFVGAALGAAFAMVILGLGARMTVYQRTRSEVVRRIDSTLQRVRRRRLVGQN